MFLNFGTLKRHSSVLEALIKFYYIVESEMLKIHSEIFSISSPIFISEDIDHVTFSNLLLSVNFTILFVGAI